jgi:hypothetical protein
MANIGTGNVRNLPKKMPSRENVYHGVKRPLKRSKTGAYIMKGTSARRKLGNNVFRSNSSSSLPAEDVSFSQVINLVSKRFISHQGVVKDARHQKKDSRQSSEPTSEYITINVSGVTFKTKLETLARYPNTLLGLLMFLSYLT